MMAIAPKDEFGTAFGQAGSAAAKKAGTPFGQATKPTPKKPVGTPFGQTGSAKKTKAEQQAAELGTPFGQVQPTINNTTAADKANADKAAADKIAKDKAVADKAANMSDAYQRLFDEFNALGLGNLVEDSKDLLMKATSIARIPEALRGTKAYTERFSANDARIKAGLKALSPAEYLDLEDSYQKVMRNYGLPASYYTPGAYGKQAGFEKLLAADVSNLELEDRIATAQKRVIYANPEVSKALKQFYPDITDGDILAYTLDPAQGLEGIKRKVTAAEIGGAAMQVGLAYKGETPEAMRARAEELGKYGVDKAMATEGYSTIGAGLQRGSELAGIYKQDPYTQTTAEEEVFKLSGAQDARKKRQKITGLEKAAFGGQTGLTSGALARDRAGGI